MSFNSELIKRREDINKTLEKYADKALMEDKQIQSMEKGLDDVQSALLYILDRFNISSSRVYGFYQIDDLVVRIM